MTINHLPPKELAPLALNLTLEANNKKVYPVNDQWEKIEISKEQSKVLSKAINGYRYRKGVADKLKGFVYRVVQAVKAIFGKSDWNKAVKTMEAFYFNGLDRSLKDKNVWHKLSNAKDTKTLGLKEYNQFISLYNKAKKEYIVAFLEIPIRATKLKIEERDATNQLKQGLKKLDVSDLKIKLDNRQTDLKKFLKTIKIRDLLKSNDV